MTVTINGSTGITTPALTNEGGLAGTTGTFSGLITANGGQIKFPTTQSASSDANTLDDYEEGTWTPTDVSGASLSFTVNSATYTKIGRLVFVTVYLSYPSTASSSSAKVGGLPFTASSAANTLSYISGRCGYTGGGQVSGQIASGETGFGFYTGTQANVTNANLSTQYIIMSGCYFTNT